MTKDTLICSVCNIRPRKLNNGRFYSHYCIPCTSYIRKETSKIKRLALIQSKPKKEGKCVFCNDTFIKQQAHDKQCHTEKCLMDQRIKKQQEAWINKKAQDRKKRNTPWSFSINKHCIDFD
jgi:hypothetical protein